MTVGYTPSTNKTPPINFHPPAIKKRLDNFRLVVLVLGLLFSGFIFKGLLRLTTSNRFRFLIKERSGLPLLIYTATYIAENWSQAEKFR